MRTLVGLALALAFVVVVVLAAMRELRTSCRVCLDYSGGRTCESARASDREHAVQQATTAACAKLARGVTESIDCASTPPLSVACGGE